MSDHRVQIASIDRASVVNTIVAANVVKAVRSCRRVVEVEYDEKAGAIVFYARVPLPKSVKLRSRVVPGGGR